PGDRGNMQWLPRSYDLSFMDTGDIARIELWFFSDDDGDTGPGFWIDDMSVTGTYAGSTGGGFSEVPGLVPVGFPVPNPCSSGFDLELAVCRAPWTVGLFDMSGRLVFSTGSDAPFGGSLYMDTGDLPQGVYTLMVRAEGLVRSRRVVVLR
ncbi:T9SS type A sorting domain-containing protein, partial [Candidatus Fermentibacterales bacterium]|nr:T9SS type A sorting domain-containing protein [Candidatus Fermentibacterales bacterium]